MPILGRVLNVGGRDGDTTLSLLRGLVNGAILEETRQGFRGLPLGDSGGQGRLHGSGQSLEPQQAGKGGVVGGGPFRGRRDQLCLVHSVSTHSSIDDGETAAYRC